MSAIQISTNLGNLALGCSTTQADLTWPLGQYYLPSGAVPRYVRLDNISNDTVAFISITPDTETITVPGSSTEGNCFPIPPLGTVTVELITAGGRVGTSAFNGGSGTCIISGITLDGTAIVVATPVDII